MLRKAWHLTAAGPQPLTFPAEYDLDALSRDWPTGYYTTFRTLSQGRKVVGLKRHLARLYQPTQAAGIQPVCDPAALRRILCRLLENWRPDEARLRLQISLDGSFWIGGETFVPPPLRLYQEGVHTITVPFQRQNPRLKRSAYLDERRQVLSQVRKAGFYEGLIVHHGRIWEGLTSNFFYVRAGVLGTAKQNILPGVTRATLLHLAAQMDIPRIYRALPVQMLAEIEEAFLCSSSRGAVPIVQIDAQTISAGQPGPITTQLMQAYQAEMARLAEPICQS